MKELFEIAGGRVLGREHRLKEKNNQDAFAWLFSEKAIVGMVADGCGDPNCPHSEVGAKIGLAIAAKKLMETVVFEGEKYDWPKILEMVRQSTLSQLVVCASSMNADFPAAINEYFLFTLVGFCLTKTESVLFYSGDGVYSVNGKIYYLGPYPENMPPYLAYAAIPEYSLKYPCPEFLSFQIGKIIKTEELESVLIGTDGVIELEKSLRGIAEFWEEDDYFRNSDMIRRKLAGLNREIIRPDWQKGLIVKESGLLADDTTLIVARRRKR